MQIHLPITRIQTNELIRIFFDFDNLELENDPLFFNDLKALISAEDDVNYITLHIQSVYLIAKALHHINMNTSNEVIHDLFLMFANIVTRYKYRIKQGV